MAARTTRLEARRRVQEAFQAALDRVIPLDDSEPLRGRTFREWEDQADAFDAAVTATLLEERAALEDTARAEAGALGRCRHCGSERLYLQQAEPKNRAMRTPHGEVVVGQQSVRCRSCGRSFSPSGAGLGPAGDARDAAVATGAAARGAGGGDAPLRQGGGGAE